MRRTLYHDGNTGRYHDAGVPGLMMGVYVARKIILRCAENLVNVLSII
jgi:hypothetical protein